MNNVSNSLVLRNSRPQLPTPGNGGQNQQQVDPNSWDCELTIGKNRMPVAVTYDR